MRGGVWLRRKGSRILSQATLHQAWPSGAMEPGSIQAVGVQEALPWASEQTEDALAPGQHSRILTLSICHLILYLSFTIASPSEDCSNPLNSSYGLAEQVINILPSDEKTEIGIHDS